MKFRIPAFLAAVAFVLTLTFSFSAVAQNKAKGAPKPKRPAKPQQVGPAVNENKATPVDRISARDGFEVELLYSVPGVEQGSWVNMCVDPKGRLIVSDQYGGLYRVTPPPVGKTAALKIEKINVDIGEAHVVRSGAAQLRTGSGHRFVGTVDPECRGAVGQINPALEPLAALDELQE